MKTFAVAIRHLGFRLAVPLSLIMSIIMAGCTGGNLPESQRYHFLKDNFGQSVKTVNFNQTLNPTVGGTPESLEGIDGRTAGMAAEKHRETFSTEHRQDRGNFRESRILENFERFSR